MENTISRVILAIVLFVSVFATSHARAQFARTEDQLMEADINEARRRAKDFKNHLALVKKRKLQQEKIGPEEVKKARAAFEERQAEARTKFIRERDARPVTPDQVIERMERETERQRERLAEQMEADRQKYIVKRNRVRSTIEREGYIDETLEFDM
ncbi:MAG: hypothetical protein V4760_05410 [Bdellovibrionota bacterium]